MFRLLHALVRESEIIQYLDDQEAQHGSLQNVHRYALLTTLTIDGQIDLDLFKLLGYFSVIGLLRMHCLTSDYRRALQQLDTINIAR